MITAVFNNAAARAVVMGGLLVVILGIWLVRPGRLSGVFLDLLAVVIIGAVFLTVVAIPLPPALVVPQVVVAFATSVFVGMRAMRRIDP